jgi:hypothetical protein
MGRKFYQLDRTGDARWVLGSIWDANGAEIDSRVFRYLDWPVERLPSRIDIYSDGDPADVSFIDCELVVRAFIADILQHHCGNDIARYPVRIDGHRDKWEIIKVLSLADCIDPARSIMMETVLAKGPPEPGDPRYVHPSDPDYAPWPYPALLQPAIDPQQVGEKKMFRPKYWEVSVIARDDVIAALTEAGATGFDETCISE